MSARDTLREHVESYGDEEHGDALFALEYGAKLLADARKAWRDKALAESELARLRNYRGRPSAGMRADIDRWAKLATESDTTLRRILGGKP